MQTMTRTRRPFRAAITENGLVPTKRCEVLAHHGYYVATLSENEALDEHDREKRAEMWRVMLECLGAFGLTVAGSLCGSTVIRDKAYALWTVCDNGGELNVERINAPETLRSVPYTSWGAMLDGATMAYRVRCVVDDCEIEYDRSFAEEAEILRAA